MEETRAQCEKKTHTPAALKGKFSAVFSRFESPSDKRTSAARQSSQPLKEPSAVVRKHSVETTTSEDSERSSGYKSQLADRLVEQKEEIVQPSAVKTVRSTPSVVKAVSEETQTKPSLTRHDAVEKPSEETPLESKPKRSVDKARSMDTAVPRGSPTGSKVLERLAKFGHTVDVAPQNEPCEEKPQQTVTTKNSSTDKFERFTHSTVQYVEDTGASYDQSKPHFDIDIQIRPEIHDIPKNREEPRQRQSGEDTSSTKTSPRHKSGTHQSEEMLNVWDTQIPVKDTTEKVGHLRCWRHSCLRVSIISSSPLI